MTAQTRPRAPWYAPATRRLAVLRVGVATLLACVFAMGPAAAASTPVHDIEAVVAQATQRAISLFDGHSAPDGGDGGPGRPADGR
jgi:hypothetical protein